MGLFFGGFFLFGGDFGYEFVVVFPDLGNLFVAGLFLGGSASDVIEEGKEGDADEGNGGFDEDVSNEKGVVRGEWVEGFVDEGEGGGEEEASKEGEARCETVEGAKIIVPRGAEEGEEEDAGVEKKGMCGRNAGEEGRDGEAEDCNHD